MSKPRARHGVLGAAIALAGALIIGAVAAATTGASHAEATIIDPTGATIGWARFTEDATGTVHVNVHVKGISPGLHGIHLHATGECTLGTTTAFSSAGGHHNPLNQLHGLGDPPGAHAGDLPNLVVNGAGNGRLVGTTDLATLSAGMVSLFDSNGSAVIIHAGPDDQVTDPTGNSGGRIGCGVIVPS
jgi:Cu-Zn family superoxide dismutase